MTFPLATNTKPLRRGPGPARWTRPLLLLLAILPGASGCDSKGGGVADSAGAEESTGVGEPSEDLAIDFTQLPGHVRVDVPECSQGTQEYRLRIRTLAGTGQEPSPGTRFRIRHRPRFDGAGTVAEPEIIGRTDERGLAVVSITPWVEASKAPKLWPSITAVVDEPGHQDGRTSTLQATGNPGLRELVLRKTPGTTLRGVVLGPSGATLEAEVEAWTATDPPEYLGRAESLAWRGFEFHLPRATVDLCLIARHRSDGAAVQRVRRNPRSSPELIRLTVNGEARLRGRMVDDEGVGVRGTRVTAVHEDLVRNPNLGRIEEVRLLAQGRGRVRHGVEVNDQGVFSFSGLRPGRYFVHAVTRSAGFLEQPLSTEPIAADGSQSPYVVRDPKLFVDLLGSDGGPLSAGVDPLPGKWQAYEDGLSLGAAWPEELGVVACEVRDGGGGTADEPFLRGTRLSGGRLRFLPRGTREVKVGWVGRGIPWNPIRVRFPEDGSDAHCTLTAPEPGPEGFVDVTVVNAGGEPLEPFWSILRILDPEGGAALVERFLLGESVGEGNPFRFTLPQGDWRIEGAAVMLGDAYCFQDIAPAVVARAAEETVRVEANEVTELRLELPEGGSLRLDLRGAPRGGRWIEPHLRRGVHSQIDPSGCLLTGDAWFVLGREGHWPHTMTFFDRELRPGAMDLDRVDLPRFGSSVHSARYPAGRYQLLGRSFDGRVQRMPVVIEDGVQTRIRVEFP